MEKKKGERDDEIRDARKRRNLIAHILSYLYAGRGDHQFSTEGKSGLHGFTERKHLRGNGTSFFQRCPITPLLAEKKKEAVVHRRGGMICGYERRKKKGISEASVRTPTLPIFSLLKEEGSPRCLNSHKEAEGGFCSTGTSPFLTSE